MTCQLDQKQRSIRYANVSRCTIPGLFKTAKMMLKKLTNGIVNTTTSKLKIYVCFVASAEYNNIALAWNKSKIVAADGIQAVVGGHNMWGDFLTDISAYPVYNVSMKLVSGLAAALDAQQRFAVSMWRQFANK